MKQPQIKKPNEILSLIKKKDIDQAEVFLSFSKSLKIDVHNQKIESVKGIEEIGCGIRIIKDQKEGFAYTSDFDESVVEQTIQCAIENAKSSEEDEFLSLPEKPRDRPADQLNLYDEKIAQTCVKEKIGLALEIEAFAYRQDKRVKKTEKVSYSEAESQIWIANSNGVNANYKSNYCGGFANVIASLNAGMEAGFGIDFVKRFEEFKPEKVGIEAAQRAAELLGAKQIPSQKIPLVFDPFVGTQILEVLSYALLADSVQKGKSLFADKIGTQVGSKILNIIDDGRLANGLGSAPFDAEGVLTRETKLIENGKLNTFLHNTYTANKGKTRSTGNAVRPSFMGLPSVGANNLYIRPGEKSPESIIASIKKGLYITRVMGIHTANPISGDFSVGASGIMIEKGQKTYPVRGITIAGNLIEMFKELDAIGSDLRFIEDVGSPTLLIHDMTVSGS
jgi:PmbA protein